MLLLVTPVRDEERFLPKVIDAVYKQSLRPSLWIILDHGSTDSTPEIIEEFRRREKWVVSIRAGKEVKGYASAVRNCMEFAISEAKNRGIEWNFLGILDGDIIPDEDYFNGLVKKFEGNPRLGMASGGLYLKNKGTEEIELHQDPTRPWGGHLIFSKECLEGIDGFPRGPAPDSVAVTLARNREFETGNFPELRAITLREMGDREGLISGYRERGTASACLGERLSIALAKALYYSRPPSVLKGLSFLKGYVSMRFIREEKAPEEVRIHYQKKRLLPLIWKRLHEKFSKTFN